MVAKFLAEAGKELMDKDELLNKAHLICRKLQLMDQFAALHSGYRFKGDMKLIASIHNDAYKDSKKDFGWRQVNHPD